MSAQQELNKLRTLVLQNGALMTKVAQESTLLTESQTIQSAIQNIDLSSVESKVQEESDAIQAKIDNIELPEIDTTAIAKQGENQDATNTAIYEGINRILSRSVVYNSSTGDLRFENVDIIIE